MLYHTIMEEHNAQLKESCVESPHQLIKCSLDMPLNLRMFKLYHTHYYESR